MDYVTAYADASLWAERWQREYQYGILLIYPPEPHLSRITALRKRYAWSQSSECDAHISLSVQVPRPVTPADVAEVQSVLSGIRPFTIRYGPIVDKPSHRGVVLAIEPQDDLTSLLRQVESTALFIGSVPRKYPYRAHMTIAEMLTWDQTYQIIEELKDLPLVGEFPLEYLSYAVPDTSFRFTERSRLPLQAQGEAP